MAEIINFSDGLLQSGERFFRDYLNEHLGDDFKVLVQYSMRKGRNGSLYGSKRPDFIVLNHNIGVWVLEVKDWHPDTIVKFQKAEVIINPKDKDGIRKRKRETNPYVQVQEYVDFLKAEFRNCGSELVQRCGNPSVPYGWGVIFTNSLLCRDDFIRNGHAAFAELDKTLFRENLDNACGLGFPWLLERWLELPKPKTRRSSSEFVPVRQQLKTVARPISEEPAIKENVEKILSPPPTINSKPRHLTWRGNSIAASLSIAVALVVAAYWKSEKNVDVIETVNTTCLHVREFPTSTSSIRGIAPFGTKVRVVGIDQNGWKEIEGEITSRSTCKASPREFRGYVNPQYLSPAH